MFFFCFFFKGATGIEPATLRSAISCSTTELHTLLFFAIYFHIYIYDRDGIRTRNRWIRSPARYPVAPHDLQRNIYIYISEENLEEKKKYISYTQRETTFFFVFFFFFF